MASSSIPSAMNATYAMAQEAFGTVAITKTSALVALVVILGISKVVNYRRQLNVLSHLPGLRIPFYPLGFPGALIPATWWNPGLYLTWSQKDTLYQQFGRDTISVVSYLAGPPSLYTANLDVARQVAGGGNKTSFIKPESASQALLLWGMNLVAADRDMWRKHRRVMQPAFNNALYEMVWTESLQTYHEMVSAEKWDSKKEIDIPIIQSLTFKFALLLIGKCGFGFNFNWFEPPKAADGNMSVQQALRIVADTHMFALFLPKWIQKLPSAKLREMREAHDQLMNFMQSQVAERREEIHAGGAGRNDAFTMLVKANEDEGTKFKLEDQELIGNVFIMLFAGHETTAHTLAATLGFLGLYSDIQEDIYQQILSVIGRDRDPGMEDYPKLDKVLNAFFEALRLFPSGYVMIREAFEDTVLHIPNPAGQEGTSSLPVQKGTTVVVDMVGVQYNSRYFDEPAKYKPSRWTGLAPESESFSAFSVGPRACIGRKFATLESVCFLTCLLRDFKVEPILRNGESREQWKERVLDAKVVLTLGVADVPVKLVRRR